MYGSVSVYEIYREDAYGKDMGRLGKTEIRSKTVLIMALGPASFKQRANIEIS